MMKTIYKLAVILLLNCNITYAQKIDLLNNNCQNTISCAVNSYIDSAAIPSVVAPLNKLSVIVTPNSLSATPKQIIHIINKTTNDIVIQMQDGSFIGVLEARITQSQWKSVQYWQPSTCGNSYVLKQVASNSTACFITPLPTGNYKTMLRYKILGKDSFYYSNEFEGSITYCDLYDTKHTPSEKLETYTKYYIGK